MDINVGNLPLIVRHKNHSLQSFVGIHVSVLLLVQKHLILFQAFAVGYSGGIMNML